MYEGNKLLVIPRAILGAIEKMRYSSPLELMLLIIIIASTENLPAESRCYNSTDIVFLLNN